MTADCFLGAPEVFLFDLWGSIEEAFPPPTFCIVLMGDLLPYSIVLIVGKKKRGTTAGIILFFSRAMLPECLSILICKTEN